MCIRDSLWGTSLQFYETAIPIGTALGIMLFIRTWYSPSDEIIIGTPNQTIWQLGICSIIGFGELPESAPFVVLSISIHRKGRTDWQYHKIYKFDLAGAKIVPAFLFFYVSFLKNT